MKKITLVLCLAVTSFLFAQTTSTFEGFNLGVDSSLNGSDQQGGFQDGNLFFPNTCDTSGSFWSGFGVSSRTDNTTPGYLNDLSCIAAEGAEGSMTYGVAYGSAFMSLTGPASGGAMEGMYINNSTYAYLSMRDGDSFAKKFGGVSGDDPDYFLLNIEKYENGMLGAEKIEFYLADFRSTNNSDDYILDEWTYVDLSSLGNADSLLFSMESSDVGQFGMNTPAYFCLDNIRTKDSPVTGISANSVDLKISVFPNPAVDFIHVQHKEEFEGTIALIESTGKTIGRYDLSQHERMDVSNLSSGLYLLNIELTDGKNQTYSIIKE
tara:strand:- start:5710 stop:6675 length:966 start_codon:yes stop_codon:yes gene_type:complete